MSHPKNDDFFPNLRFTTLQKYAKAWVNLTKEMGFPEHGFPLKHIRLFDATPIVGNQSYQRRKDDKENPITDFEYFRKRYIVTFEFPDFENSQDMPQDNNAFEFARKTLEFNLKFPEPTLWRNSSFREVYKEKPDDNWLSEWVFQVGVPKDVDEEFCWVLYDWAGKDIQILGEFKPAIIRGKELCGIIGDLYRQMKEQDEGPFKLKDRDDLKRVAIEIFEDASDKYNPIKEHHLSDIGLYTTDATKAKRDFCGKLVRKILQDEKIKVPEYKKLYSLIWNTVVS